jgi:hypothetical protein
MQQFLNGRVAVRRSPAAMGGDAERGRTRYRRHVRCQCRTVEQIEVSIRKRGRISAMAGVRGRMRRRACRSGHSRRRWPASAAPLARARVSGAREQQQQCEHERSVQRRGDAWRRGTAARNRRLEQRSALSVLLAAGPRPRPRRAHHSAQTGWPGQDGKQQAAQQRHEVLKARACATWRRGQSPRRRLPRRAPRRGRPRCRRRSGSGLRAVLRQAASRERSLAVRTRRGGPTAVLRRHTSRGRFCGRVSHPGGWRALHDWSACDAAAGRCRRRVTSEETRLGEGFKVQGGGHHARRQRRRRGMLARRLSRARGGA